MAAKPEVLMTSLLQIKKVVSKLKWGYKTSCMCTTSTDSGRHQCMLNIQDGLQKPEVVTT